MMVIILLIIVKLKGKKYMALMLAGYPVMGLRRMRGIKTNIFMLHLILPFMPLRITVYTDYL